MYRKLHTQTTNNIPTRPSICSVPRAQPHVQPDACILDACSAQHQRVQNTGFSINYLPPPPPFFVLSVFAVINNTKRAVVCVPNRLYILCTFRAVLNCYSHARTPHMVITSRSEQHRGPNNSQVMCESKHLLLRRPAAADRRVHQ